MKDYLLFLVLGTGAGAVYAALGLGLVLIHRASGVVNLAHGAMAMYATYVFSELRASGELVLPVPGLPARVPVTDDPSLGVALALALGVAAVLALVLYAVVFRPLRSSPPLAGVVASVGLALALQAAAVLQFGPGNRSVPSVLPARPLTVGGVTVPSDRVELAALVAGAAVLLWAVGRFTLVGLAARAAAQDQLGAMVTGWSPDALAAGAWVLAGVLGALGGILVGPITQLNPTTYTLLVVPALAAALVGRLSSFGVTVVAALGLGMAQSEIVLLQDRFRWLPRLGLGAGLPLVVVVVAVALRGRRRPGPGAPTAGRLPAAGRPQRVARPAAALVAIGAAALVALPGAYRLGLVNSMVAAIVCLSLVVLTGYGGQISLAQMAFAGVAGFSLSKLAQDAGVPFPLAPLLAAGAAALVGLALAVPALRVRGLDLALVTIAAAVAVEELVFKSTAVSGGFLGTPVPAPELLGVDLGPGGVGPGPAGGPAGAYPRPVFGLVVLGVLAVTAVAVARLRRGRAGRRMIAVRANEAAAASLGVDVARTKLAAFTISAFIAGMAGTLVGYEQGQLSAESFGVFISLSYLGLAYVGGIASVSGALVGGALVAGGIVFTAADRLTGLGRYHLLASGVALVAVVVLAPEGIAGGGRRLVERWRARR